MRPWVTVLKLFQINCVMTSWWVPALFKKKRKHRPVQPKTLFRLFMSIPALNDMFTNMLQDVALNMSPINWHWVFYFFFSPTFLSMFLHLLCFNGFCSSSLCSLCYKQVPFGPLAFMPGKLVHTNEVTVLLGDNWFAKCSAKQAQKIVDHRMKCESVFFSEQIALFIFNVATWHCWSSSTRGCSCIRSVLLVLLLIYHITEGDS